MPSLSNKPIAGPVCPLEGSGWHNLVIGLLDTAFVWPLAVHHSSLLGPSHLVSEALIMAWLPRKGAVVAVEQSENSRNFSVSDSRSRPFPCTDFLACERLKICSGPAICMHKHRESCVQAELWISESEESERYMFVAR
ncbi:hypothetical protein PoB_000151000 [Plakobranchus ocellatus]|uniref:Uncharacterized protein n=1 Tax=Plakobranchus ocellatus TaxID=259542 RepID=A0AAV3XW08_9GAST|nr:hypothetical protein PoB_000151000 [Plakobranchus ocellatus]